ncbi:MAG: cytochrome P450 [Betaproteobacteria bacterium]|nr:cytochrome P450 [Betaproteobacteria bacterium]MDH5219645.1 cytochrome P450 [Betaproteobacteria bacterium]MDH5349642.1 cytochrome P450 [Betaproteobacteria bacterium]
MSADYRPEDPAFLADPFPLLRRLQDEDPCHWSPRLKAWVVTRYEDVREICLQRDMSSDRLRPFFAALPPPEARRIADIIRYLSLWMVFRDPPEHTRLRRLTSKVFHVKSMHAMRPRIEALMHWLFDAIGGRREFDFIADFAGPLPALVIMDMLGVPREELPRVKRLSDDMALFIGSSRMSPEKYDIAQAATHELAEFFRDMISARRAASAPDLLSELVHLRDGEDRLTVDELVATCILLLFAGHETTTNHLANGLLGLMRFPLEMRRLRDDPALAPAAVEELLRYDGPNGVQGRIVARDCELHGKRLKAGERLFIQLNAANRDPRAYPDPDLVDLARSGPAHLAFGFGAHLCLGFPLARLEGQIAFPAVLARWPGLEPAQERYEWLNSMVFRGMKAMPVRVRG